MSESAPSPETDLAWRMREHESQLLATLMRTSRLTLLSAESGLDRAGLLTNGLLPLLRRRAGDAVGDEDRETRVVIPFSDRRIRRAGRSSTRVAERVVLFDAWGASPMAELQAVILASLPADAITYVRSARLAPMLGELSRRFDAHFLIVLDGFERFWDPDLSPEAAEQFIDEFSEAVNLDELRAHFLLSIDDVAEPRLEALRRRIAGFDDSTLHLLRGQNVPGKAPLLQQVTPASGPVDALRAAIDESRTVPSARAVPLLLDALSPPSLPSAPPARGSTAPKKSRRPRPPRVPFVKPAPIDTKGVYAFIESTLSQTASDFAPWHDANGMPSELSAPLVNQSMLESQAWEGRMPGADSDETRGLPISLVEPRSPIDKWLDSVSTWLRRNLPRK